MTSLGQPQPEAARLSPIAFRSIRSPATSATGHVARQSTPDRATCGYKHACLWGLLPQHQVLLLAFSHIAAVDPLERREVGLGNPVTRSPIAQQGAGSLVAHRCLS